MGHEVLALSHIGVVLRHKRWCGGFSNTLQPGMQPELKR